MHAEAGPDRNILHVIPNFTEEDQFAMEHVEFCTTAAHQQLACRVISASAELLVFSRMTNFGFLRHLRVSR